MDKMSKAKKNIVNSWVTSELSFENQGLSKLLLSLKAVAYLGAGVFIKHTQSISFLFAFV